MILNLITGFSFVSFIYGNNFVSVFNEVAKRQDFWGMPSSPLYVSSVY
jgi:hypothetical protein